MDRDTLLQTASQLSDNLLGIINILNCLCHRDESHDEDVHRVYAAAGKAYNALYDLREATGVRRYASIDQIQASRAYAKAFGLEE